MAQNRKQLDIEHWPFSPQGISHWPSSPQTPLCHCVAMDNHSSKNLLPIFLNFWDPLKLPPFKATWRQFANSC